MENFNKKFGQYRQVRVVICFLFLLFLATSNPLVAATAADSATTSQATDEPSTKNIAKNLEAANKEIQAEQLRQEILTWTCMILGFSLVIGIAWFTTVKAKKRAQKEAEAKQRYLQKHFDPNKKHLHKARR
jgi:hypothetical protein